MRFAKSIILATTMAAIFIVGWQYYRQGTDTKNQNVYSPLDRLEEQGSDDFALEDLSGVKQNLKSIKADLILVHFWASWCAPCVAEYPSLERMTEKMKGRVRVVAISVDESRADWVEFLKQYSKDSKNILQVWDPKKTVSESYGTDRLPETYILNSDYKLVRKVPNSEDWDGEGAIGFLQSFLKP